HIEFLNNLAVFREEFYKQNKFSGKIKIIEKERKWYQIKTNNYTHADFDNKKPITNKDIDFNSILFTDEMDNFLVSEYSRKRDQLLLDSNMSKIYIQALIRYYSSLGRTLGRTIGGNLIERDEAIKREMTLIEKETIAKEFGVEVIEVEETKKRRI
ncbi:hypothetical protein, partial [Enterobacter hormaechei]|uniref:hypothetical protein n=1 Tax=Enterobacter hormaechei TaxID=158836 RepID=UPI0023B07E27